MFTISNYKKYLVIQSSDTDISRLYILRDIGGIYQVNLTCGKGWLFKQNKILNILKWERYFKYKLVWK